MSLDNIFVGDTISSVVALDGQVIMARCDAPVITYLLNLGEQSSVITWVSLLVINIQ